jgi:hypothetical protein
VGKGTNVVDVIDTGEGKGGAVGWETDGWEAPPPTAGACPCTFGGPKDRADLCSSIVHVGYEVMSSRTGSLSSIAANAVGGGCVPSCKEM